MAGYKLLTAKANDKIVKQKTGLNSPAFYKTPKLTS